MTISIYDGDQPTTTSAVVGITETNMTASGVDAVVSAYSEAPVYIFSTDYVFQWNGQMLSFRYGVPYQLDQTLLAALTAVSAPISAG